MALGRQGERQADLMIGWAERPRSPGHAFYDRLQAVLIEAGFDRFAESECAPYYASRRGRPSLPPGRSVHHGPVTTAAASAGGLPDRQRYDPDLLRVWPPILLRKWKQLLRGLMDLRRSRSPPTSALLPSPA